MAPSNAGLVGKCIIDELGIREQLKGGGSTKKGEDH
jgi:hypothetical protein